MIVLDTKPARDWQFKDATISGGIGWLTVRARAGFVVMRLRGSAQLLELGDWLERRGGLDHSTERLASTTIGAAPLMLRACSHLPFTWYLYIYDLCLTIQKDELEEIISWLTYAGEVNICDKGGIGERGNNL